jgi:hypothetical protein
VEPLTIQSAQRARAASGLERVDHFDERDSTGQISTKIVVSLAVFGCLRRARHRRKEANLKIHQRTLPLSPTDN